VVEDIGKRREPLPQLVGVYFMAPTDNNVRQLVRDFSLAAMPQYKAAHVFFSSKPSVQHLAAIRECPHLVSRLRTLKEVNLEYLLVDSRTFCTNEEGALKTFFGASVDSSTSYRVEIEVMTARLATVFATLREMPAIRFRAAAPPGEEFPPGLESRLLVAQRIAVELHEQLSALQRAGMLPERETCELILTDRGFDPVAPVIHEWTYEAMAFDLLSDTPALHDNVFVYDAETQGGKLEKKEHILNERDALFVDLRHKHFAAASQAIANLMDEFKAKNRVGKGGRGVSELELRNMSKLIQSLPQYRDQLSKLAAHVEIASRLNNQINENQLAELGKLEQVRTGVGGDGAGVRGVVLLACIPVRPAVECQWVPACLRAADSIDAAASRASMHAPICSSLSCSPLAGPGVRRRHQQGGDCLPHRQPGHPRGRQGAPAHVLQRHSPGEAGRHARGAVAKGGAPHPGGHGLCHQPGVPGGAGAQARQGRRHHLWAQAAARGAQGPGAG
jgi:hypothetical protein